MVTDFVMSWHHLIPTENILLESQTSISFNKEGPSFVKVLGLQWHPAQDVLSYGFSETNRPFIKRTAT